MANLERKPEKLSPEDLDYLRTQGGSLGSGLLGGWSEVEYGGFFDEGGPEVDEVRAEIAPLRAMAGGAPAEPAPDEQWLSDEPEPEG